VRILAFLDWYLPGYKAGGPVRTVANMVAQLAGELDFWIATRDRDLGDVRPYQGVRRGTWAHVDGARVLYLGPRDVGLRGIARVCRSTPHDAVYLNSFFSRLTVAYLLARRVSAVPRVPVVLAPRGELAPAALGLRARRKRLYLRAAARLGLLRGLRWQASAEHERADIEAILRERSALRDAADVVIAPDLVAKGLAERGARSPKIAGRARFLFLSRISPMKNLHTAIRLVGGLRGDVSLHVHGPVSDPAYWAECERERERLPSNVAYQYRGVASPDDVVAVMRRYDFFLLPTLGENFGHVVAEALGAGTPAVLSERTSWSWIAERNAGWCVPLGDEARWLEVLQGCVDMGPERHAAMCAAAEAAGDELSAASGPMQMNRQLFRWARDGSGADQVRAAPSRM
jgi:glycosyltransferase involved in cell wall biosynthesis